MISRFARPLGALGLALAIVALPAWSGATLARSLAPHTTTPIGPKQYYLVLGDSLAYGYQPNGDYQHGYADDFYQYLKRQNSALQYVNMACPGETTDTFQKGGCADLGHAPLKYSYSGSQLQAALSFIKAHPGQVSPVSINVGAADVLKDADPTKCEIQQTQLIIDGQNALVNLKTIVKALQGALAGSGDLLTINYYNPYLSIPQSRCPNASADPNTDPQFHSDLVQQTSTLNTLLKKVATTQNALLADVYTAFGGDNENVTAYTWFGKKPSTIDSTTAGHAAIANAFEQIYPLSGPPSPLPTAPATTTVTLPLSPTGTLPPTPFAIAPTPTPFPSTETPEPTTAPLNLSVTLPQRRVYGGHALSIVIQTGTSAHVIVALQVQGALGAPRKAQGSAKALPHATLLYSLTNDGDTDARGHRTAYLTISYRPRHATEATITVTASTLTAAVAVSAHITILPPR